MSAVMCSDLVWIQLYTPSRTPWWIDATETPWHLSNVFIVGFFPVAATVRAVVLSSWLLIRNFHGSLAWCLSSDSQRFSLLNGRPLHLLFPWKRSSNFCHRHNAGSPLVLIAKSAEANSASGVLCAKLVCPLEPDDSGNLELGPWASRWNPDVLRKVNGQPAKSASQNKWLVRSYGGSPIQPTMTSSMNSQTLQMRRCNRSSHRSHHLFAFILLARNWIAFSQSGLATRTA